ncbi:MAG: hypothetical protein Q4C71_00490 [Microbacteriaceae bacterium]|nr:hypothetical protein [Microbacteriaceae bacterium]
MNDSYYRRPPADHETADLQAHNTEPQTETAAAPKLDKSVYRRRRMLVLGVPALFLIGLILVFVSGQMRSADTGNKTPITLPEKIVDTGAPKNDPLNQPLQPCGTGEIKATAHTDKDTYEPNQKPKIWLTVENTTEKPCAADMGTAKMLFEISSAGKVVWASIHCQKKGEGQGADPNATLPVILQPKKPLKTAAIEWDRTKSAPETCATEKRPPADAAGAVYELRVAIADVPGQRAKQFSLK